MSYRDILFVITSVGIAVAVYWSADQIPRSLMSNVSAGLVPKIVAVLIICLALLYLWQMFAKRIAKASETATAPDDQSALNYKPILITSILLGLFILVIQLEVAPFWITGFFFVFVSVLALTSISTKKIITAAIVAAVGIGTTIIVFTKIFTVILP